MLTVDRGNTGMAESINSAATITNLTQKRAWAAPAAWQGGQLPPVPYALPPCGCPQWS